MRRKKFRFIAIVLSFCLIFEQSGFAQVAGRLDIPKHIANLGSSFVQDKFRPVHLRSISYDSEQNNLKLLLDKGDSKNLKESSLKESTKTLLTYFLTGISLPNKSFWVNLRPDSENDIIDEYLAKTDVGKILLEADVQLKKDTARFTSPETPEGRKYWDSLYKKAGEIFGYDNVTIPTLMRPWIMPDEIIIRETGNNAYIYKATLKVLLEEDYLKGSINYNFKDPRQKTLNEYSSKLMRELIIPKLTREINTAKRYAPLRQVYYSLILAQWFKARYQGKSNPYSDLIDKKNLSGITSEEPWSKTTYFKQYRESFQNGEYSLKEPVYTPSGQSIRSYFSGGIIIPDLTLRPEGPNQRLASAGEIRTLVVKGNSPVLAEEQHTYLATALVDRQRNVGVVAESPARATTANSPAATQQAIQWVSAAASNLRMLPPNDYRHPEFLENLLESLDKGGSEKERHSRGVSVRTVSLDNRALILHGINPNIITANNSLLKPGTSWDVKLDIALVLQPHLAAFAIREGDSPNQMFPGGMGVILKGGQITFAGQQDSGSVSAGLYERVFRSSKQGTGDLVNNIKQVVSPDGSRGSVSGYNELHVTEPAVAGFYFTKELADSFMSREELRALETIRKRVNEIRQSSTINEIDKSYLIRDIYGNLLFKRSDLREIMAKVGEWGLPVYIIDNGVVREAAFDNNALTITPGRQVTIDAVLDTPYRPPSKKVAETRARIENDSPFVPDAAGLIIGSRQMGRATYLDLTLKTNTQRQSRPDFAVIDRRQVPVQEVVRIGIVGLRYFIYQGRVIKEVTGYDSHEVNLKNTSHIDLEEWAQGPYRNFLNLGNGVVVPFDKKLNDAQTYLEGMNKEIQKWKERLDRVNGQDELTAVYLRHLAFHLYGFAEEARKDGNEELALKAERIAAQAVSRADYQNLLKRRLTPQDTLRINPDLLDEINSSYDRETAVANSPVQTQANSPLQESRQTANLPVGQKLDKITQDLNSDIPAVRKAAVERLFKFPQDRAIDSNARFTVGRVEIFPGMDPESIKDTVNKNGFVLLTDLRDSGGNLSVRGDNSLLQSLVKEGVVSPDQASLPGLCLVPQRFPDPFSSGGGTIHERDISLKLAGEGPAETGEGALVIKGAGGINIDNGTVIYPKERSEGNDFYGGMNRSAALLAAKNAAVLNDALAELREKHPEKVPGDLTFNPVAIVQPLCILYQTKNQQGFQDDFMVNLFREKQYKEVEEGLFLVPVVDLAEIHKRLGGPGSAEQWGKLEKEAVLFLYRSPLPWRVPEIALHKFLKEKYPDPKERLHVLATRYATIAAFIHRYLDAAAGTAPVLTGSKNSTMFGRLNMGWNVFDYDEFHTRQEHVEYYLREHAGQAQAAAEREFEDIRREELGILKETLVEIGSAVLTEESVPGTKSGLIDEALKVFEQVYNDPIFNPSGSTANSPVQTQANSPVDGGVKQTASLIPAELIENTAKKIISILDINNKAARKIYAIVSGMHEFSMGLRANIKQPSTQLVDSAAQGAWRFVEDKVGPIEAIRKMGPEEFATRIGVVTFDSPLKLFTLDKEHAELIKRLREKAGGAEQLWDLLGRAVSSDLGNKEHYTTAEQIPEILWLFDPEITQDGIYYSPEGYKKSDVPITKSVFFHELIEQQLLQAGAIDPVFSRFFGHAHPIVIQEELKFASQMGELNIRINSYRGYLEERRKSMETSKPTPLEEASVEKYFRQIESYLDQIEKTQASPNSPMVELTLTDKNTLSQMRSQLSNLRQKLIGSKSDKKNLAEAAGLAEQMLAEYRGRLGSEQRLAAVYQTFAQKDPEAQKNTDIHNSLGLLIFGAEAFIRLGGNAEAERRLNRSIEEAINILNDSLEVIDKIIIPERSVFKTKTLESPGRKEEVLDINGLFSDSSVSQAAKPSVASANAPAAQPANQKGLFGFVKITNKDGSQSFKAAAIKRLSRLASQEKKLVVNALLGMAQRRVVHTLSILTYAEELKKSIETGQPYAGEDAFVLIDTSKEQWQAYAIIAFTDTARERNLTLWVKTPDLAEGPRTSLGAHQVLAHAVSDAIGSGKEVIISHALTALAKEEGLVSGRNNQASLGRFIAAHSKNLMAELSAAAQSNAPGARDMLNKLEGSPNSPLDLWEEKTPETDASYKGGIDFRAMPAVTQPMRVPAVNANNLSTGRPDKFNPDAELRQIQNMLRAGMSPSIERVKEYLLISCQHENAGSEVNKVLACIADILRLEEDYCQNTDSAMKELLVLLESGNAAKDMAAALRNIKVLPKEPKLRKR